MKHRIRLLALCLLAVLLCSGCGVMTRLANDAQTMNNLVKAELDAFAAGDVDAAYAGLYPGQSTKEDFADLFAQMQEYCPLPAEYEFKALSHYSDTTYGTGGKQTGMNGEYQVSFGGRSFYVIAGYVEDSNGSGFQTWRILNEEDHKLYQGVG